MLAHDCTVHAVTLACCVATRMSDVPYCVLLWYAGCAVVSASSPQPANTQLPSAVWLASTNHTLTRRCVQLI